MNKKSKIITAIFAVLLLITSIAFAVVYKPLAKTNEIYSSALTKYNEGDYQNSYYLFSKVSFLSNLKPPAVYHQAECAKNIGDINSAVKQYQFLFSNYPNSRLSLRAKYLAAQELVNINPKLAKKYFDEIISSNPNSDYAIAAEYYSGLILMKEYQSNPDGIFPLSGKIDVENHFRHYLSKAPGGRLALDVIKNWIELKKDISKDDYLLFGKSYYLFGNCQKAKEYLNKAGIAESWAQDVMVSYALKDYPRAKYLTELGLKEYAGYVDIKDIIAAVDIYMLLSESKYEAASYLTSLANSKGGDYVMSLKCRYSNLNDQDLCYKSMYIKYPEGLFSSDALAQVFLSQIRANNLDDARKIGKDFLNKFPLSENSPMVLYWMGKIAQKQNDFSEYNGYYRSVISKYPDSYYAYRAYLQLNHRTNPIITDYIKELPVEYPYKNVSKNDLIIKLVDLKDFDVLDEIAKDNDFIYSWVLYKKGDYSHSMLAAREGMDKIEKKPDKFDLRWRLVYPIDYYGVIKKYAGVTGNNAPLILSVIREESYFNPQAKSIAGASGLMQLMPSTASEIAAKHSITNYSLFNPVDNIRLGNYYYAQLKSMLSGMDVSAIAAYNGGIGSVSRWKNTLYFRDTDEFVEQIPYPETKNYVKKVFRSYWNYVRIYNGNN